MFNLSVTYNSVNSVYHNRITVVDTLLYGSFVYNYMYENRLSYMLRNVVGSGSGSMISVIGGLTAYSLFRSNNKYENMVYVGASTMTNILFKQIMINGSRIKGIGLGSFAFINIINTKMPDKNAYCMMRDGIILTGISVLSFRGLNINPRYVMINNMFKVMTYGGLLVIMSGLTKKTIEICNISPSVRRLEYSFSRYDDITTGE